MSEQKQVNVNRAADAQSSLNVGFGCIEKVEYDQTYRQKFMATFKGKFNLSCYAWDGKISNFADPRIENMYEGWKFGFIQGRNELPNLEVSERPAPDHE